MLRNILSLSIPAPQTQPQQAKLDGLIPSKQAQIPNVGILGEVLFPLTPTATPRGRVHQSMLRSGTPFNRPVSRRASTQPLSATRRKPQQKAHLRAQQVTGKSLELLRWSRHQRALRALSQRKVHPVKQARH